MHSATLEIQDGSVRYYIDGDVELQLPVRWIRVIGEVTTPNGPFLDDYYFCFASGPDCWYQASFYAEGREIFLKSAAEVFGCEFSLSLIRSTDFASNVLWPPRLAGKPMFTFAAVPPTTWLGQLSGSSTYTQDFSEAVVAELGTKLVS